MKLSFLLFILYSTELLSQKCNFQNDFIYNDSIKYNIVFITRGSIYSKSHYSTGYYVRTIISKKLERSLKNKNFQFWLQKLNDPETDRASDILLHYIYKQEASVLFIVENDLSKWELVKNSEIDKWRSFFKGGL